MRTKRLRRGTLAALLLASVAACGSGSSTGAEGPGAGGAKPALTIWVNSADTAALKDLYARFTKQTGYRLEPVSFPSDGFEKAVMQRWSTGDRPDVLEWHGNFNWVAAVNPRETMFDLTDEPFVAKTVGGILESNASLGGRVYGAVLNTPTAFGLFYNKDVLAKAGVQPPTTAAQVLAACTAIKQADPAVTPMQESGGSLWTPLVAHGAFMADSLQAGFLQKVIDRTAKVNDADSPWLASLTFYKQLQTAGCFNSDLTTATFENSAKPLLDGKVAMVSMHTGLIQQAIDASDVATVNATIGWTPWSQNRPVVTAETSPIGTYYLPKTGKADRETGARAFLGFITGPAYGDYVTASKQLPTLDGYPAPTDLPAPWAAVQSAIEKNGSVPPIWSLLPGITDLVNYPGRLITGELTPKAAVDLLQRQAEQGAKQAGLPAWPS